MQLTEKTQQAYREYEAAKKARREIAKTIKDAKSSDTTLTDLEDEKKQAATAYKAEAAQFEAKHERLFQQLDDAKSAEKEAKAIFDELYVHASAESIANTGAVQLSLFGDDGRQIEVELVTKIKVAKVVIEAVNPDDLDDDEREAIQQGLADVAAGRVHGPYDSAEEMIADLEHDGVSDKVATSLREEAEETLRSGKSYPTVPAVLNALKSDDPNDA